MFERQTSTTTIVASLGSRCQRLIRSLAGASAAVTFDAAIAIAPPSKTCPTDSPFSNSHIASSDTVRSG